MVEDEAVAVETPFALARRLHTQGVSAEEIVRQLRARGSTEEEASIAARAGRGEAGGPAELEAPVQEFVPGLPTAPPAETPSHPCPRHAAWPVAGTCVRCGAFFCTQCVVEAGLSRVPADQLCPDCDRRGARAPALGGWLILVAINVGLVSPLSIVFNVGQSFVQLPELDQRLLAPVVTEMLVNLAFLGFLLFAAWNFFQRKRKAVPLMIGVYALNMGVFCLGLVFLAWVEAIVGQDLELPQDPGEVGRTFIGGSVWILYFLRSKRVQETFVVD